MPTASETTTDLRARQLVADALAEALGDPRAAPGDARLVGAPLRSAWRLVAGPHRSLGRGDLGFGEILPGEIDFEPVIEWLQLDPARRERVLQRIFGLVISRTAAPCETEYLESHDVFHRTQQLADIAGFYRAFGFEPARQPPRRPDHIALEVGFVALLLEKLAASGQDDPAREEHERIARDALASFLADHLAGWAPAFGQRVMREGTSAAEGLSGGTDRAETLLLAGVARALCGWIVTERRAADLPPLRRVAVLNPAPADEAGAQCDACEG